MIERSSSRAGLDAPTWVPSSLFTAALLLLASTAGCRRVEKDAGEAPPPRPSATASVCRGAAPVSGDRATLAFFVRTVGDYCIDPNGEVRAYGAEAPLALDEGCGLFDGECPVYKRHGLERLVMLRYVDGAGSSSSVEVKLSRFATPEGAFAFFTQRVVGDSDPAKLTVKPLVAGAVGALGAGNAYAYRGRYVAEFDYRSLTESPDQLRLSSARVLPPLAQALGEKLPGEKQLPAAARALPEDRRLPLAVSATLANMLGVTGLGAGTLAHYRDGDKRWCVAALARETDEDAGDVLELLTKHAGAHKVEGALPEVKGVTLTIDGARGEWLFVRRGAVVLGVGDDPFALAHKSAEAHVPLDPGEKLARLKVLALGVEAPLPSAGASAKPRPPASDDGSR